jgi:NADPH-dependent curcumin reductase
MENNKQVVLASRPQAAVTPDNFRVVEAPIPTPGEGEVLVRNVWLSLDPYMRGRMNDVKSYAPSVAIGAVMVGQTVGEVVESRHPGFKNGDKVLTGTGWQLYGVARGKELMLVDASRVPASYYLGILGMPGMTAWFGLFEIGKPKQGETVVVSAASGAVGSVVGQLAKSEGCRVVGIAGGRRKCDYVVDELGFDACVDYKAGKLHEDLRAACPKGIDVDFENVGGEIMDEVFMRLNFEARVVLCGMISQYDNAGAEWKGQVNFNQLLMSRATVKGFIVSDHLDMFPAGAEYLGKLFADGKLQYDETIVEGFENALDALHKLFTGGNTGKLLVHVGDPSGA